MRVKSRRSAREAAMRALYEWDVARAPFTAVLEDTIAASDLPTDLATYAKTLALGAYEHREEIDSKLQAAVSEWKLERLARVDLAVLRVAAFEVLFCDATPPAVSLNEAIEIAKKYSTAESGKFVNGVLASLLAHSPKAHWDVACAPPEFVDEEPAPPEPEIDESVDEEPAGEEPVERVGDWTIRSGGEGEP